MTYAVYVRRAKIPTLTLVLMVVSFWFGMVTEILFQKSIDSAKASVEFCALPLPEKALPKGPWT